PSINCVINNLRTKYRNYTISPVRMGEFSHSLSAQRSLKPGAAKGSSEPKLRNAALGMNGRFNIGAQSSCIIRNIAQNLAAMASTSVGMLKTELEMETTAIKLSIWFWAAAKIHVSV
ncbi:hypothetical protein, partial [Shimia abyssi]